MRKFPLVAASAVLGFALLGGSVQAVRASEEGPVPGESIKCYYNMYHCSYPGDNYWSGCNPNFPEGWITTATARALCETYHSN